MSFVDAIKCLCLREEPTEERTDLTSGETTGNSHYFLFYTTKNLFFFSACEIVYQAVN